MIAKLFARVLIFAVMYLFICAVIYITSYFSLSKKFFINLPGFKAVQKNLYWNNQYGFVDIWQNKNECISFDKELIYIPKIGACKYKNAEFDTVLNFNKYGRLMPKQENKNKKPIIVIGDSHAMGWGVNDDETFSYFLQKSLNTQVYNLAVSSYGTIREIIRLNRTNLLKNSDFVVIQYHENDFVENTTFDKIKKNDYQKEFLKLSTKKNNDIISTTKFILRTYKSSLRLIFSDITGFFVKNKKEINFDPHYSALIETIKTMDDFDKKKIIIFFSNGPESRFYNFPSGPDLNYQNIYFIDIKLDKQDHFFLDKHPNINGHKKISLELEKILKKKFY